MILHPENSAGLYHTTGSVEAAPVNKPFTTRKGSKQTKKETTNWVSHLGLNTSKTVLKAKANSTEESVYHPVGCCSINNIPKTKNPPKNRRFSLGLFSLFWVFGNLDFATVFSLAPMINGNLLNIITLFLLIGAMAKSAQIGLHI